MTSKAPNIRAKLQLVQQLRNQQKQKAEVAQKEELKAKEELVKLEEKFSRLKKKYKKLKSKLVSNEENSSLDTKDVKSNTNDTKVQLPNKVIEYPGDGNYESYGTAWKSNDSYNGCLPTGLCNKCDLIYKHITSKKFVNKTCSNCGKWEKWSLSCRRHNLSACDKDCAVELAEKFNFPLLHFDGAYIDSRDEIIIPDYHI